VIEGRHIRGPRGGLLGGELVFRCLSFRFLQAQLHLAQQPGAAFRALAIKLMLQLGDLQLLMGNQGLVGGGTGTCCGQFRLQRIDIIRQLLGASGHDGDGIINLVV
jgi:hypothetical protein